MLVSDTLLKSGIGRFVIENVPQVENTASVKVAADTYHPYPSGSMFVVDSGTRALSGVITGDDFANLYRRGAQPQNAEDLAPKEVIVAIRRDAKLWQPLKIMNGENKLGRWLDRLPVVDAQGKPVGIVTRDRLTRVLADFEKA